MKSFYLFWVDGAIRRPAEKYLEQHLTLHTLKHERIAVPATVLLFLKPDTGDGIKADMTVKARELPLQVVVTHPRGARRKSHRAAPQWSWFPNPPDHATGLRPGLPPGWRFCLDSMYTSLKLIAGRDNHLAPGLVELFPGLAVMLVREIVDIQVETQAGDLLW